MKCEMCILAEEVAAEEDTENDFDKKYKVVKAKCEECGNSFRYPRKRKLKGA
mgnify:FL=1